MRKLYTDNQILAFHQLYIAQQTVSMTAFASECGISYHALWKGCKRLHLPIIPQDITRRKFPVNSNYFTNIDTPEKAYILGFLFADGCNHENTHNVEISLAQRDQEILVKISKILLHGNVHLNEYQDKRNKRNRVMLCVINKQISSDLQRHGCVARKTFILKFPSIPEPLHSHFIRGYFDGDGMLVIYRNAEFSITSTQEMLDEIGNAIAKLGVNYTICKRHKKRKNNNFTLRVHGNQQIETVCNYMYRDAIIYLERKHACYLRLQNRTGKRERSTASF